MKPETRRIFGKEVTLHGSTIPKADADITILDPQTVRDNSTIERGGLPGALHGLRQRQWS
jgi:hypothetical protein